VDAKEFRRNARFYNKALAFTSTGGSGHLVGMMYEGRGPPMYKIQGEIYHQLGSLLPNPNCPPVYSQLFIYDPGDALRFRLSRNSERNPATMSALQDVMNDCHPFVNVYRQAFELTRITSVPDYHLRLHFLRATDRHRYNIPSASHELAAIIPGDIDTCVNSRDVIIRPRGGPLQRVSECNPAYVTLHFPLLAPTGQEGWNINIPYVNTPSPS